jgi:PST family polysaccharide transporter
VNIKEYKEKLFKSDTRRRLIENFLSLSVLQIANYILPLITLPYLVRVLGPEKFGLIAFSQAFIGYFMILTDYGFNLSATRDISINRENKEKVSEIFSSVMIIKLALMVISLILMSIIILSFEKFRKDWIVYYLTFGMVVGQVLFPVWFFQGMEKMKYITFLNILAKVIFTVAIFVFVKEASDYLYVPLLNSLGFIIAGILGLWIVFKDFEVSFKFVGLEELKRQLKEGWHIFLSQVNITFFNNTNVIILGLFTNNTIVGYYSAAEKLIRAVMGLQIPLINSVYPTMSKLLKEDINKAVAFGKKLLIYGTFTYVTLISIILLLSNEVIILLLGDNFTNSEIIFKIMLIIPITVFINNIYGTQFLINIGHSDKFSKIIIISGMSNLILCPILTYFFSYIGTAISWVIAEFFVIYGMYYYTTKYIEQLKLKYILRFERH